ncbi:AcrB/AcrD/AcrF family protein [Sphingomonas sp. GCM10030256]|uniref:AcrB/AcrD/AcrF family protein n=1 Tax=Sphingomonas sp. GCM10030256 TaxID=3273427 RepID=UPI00361D03BA
MSGFLDWAARRWRWIVLYAWILGCIVLINSKLDAIRLFDLTDTDDNMRIAQVRAWLAGQDWFDLRQYKLNPPDGANIHWSHLVDLPIAALITVGKWFTSGAQAERLAVAAAPLIPFFLLITALAQICRRLIAPAAFLLMFVALWFAGSTLGMFLPNRIDHHNWQLTLLATALVGLADPHRQRGGLVTGIATALSLSIGLEMLIYLALAGAAQVLMWVDDRDQRERLGAYAIALAGGTAFGFLVFASYANRLPVCDALSPVWLSDALLAGGMLVLLAWWSPADWRWRLGAAAVAGLAVAAFHALAWPTCLSRLEGVSPEVAKLWLNNVREAKPIYEHSPRIMVNVLTLPVAGLIGWALLLWNVRGNRDLLRRTLAVAALFATAFLLLFWQTRAGPAAQMMAVPGAVAFVWVLLPLTWRARNWAVMAVGSAAIVVVGLGGAAPLLLDTVMKTRPTKRETAVARANRLCPSLPAMRAVARQPKGMVFTFVDLAPRIISVTHHNSVAGPYHRNGQAILDTMLLFRGSADQARTIAARYRADYLLICPNMSQATVFMAGAPQGFYGQLQRGQVPGWLQPVDLGKGSPLRMWRIVG